MSDLELASRAVQAAARSNVQWATSRFSKAVRSSGAASIRLPGLGEHDPVEGSTVNSDGGTGRPSRFAVGNTEIE
ncbi:hypothetical protein EW146_g10075 [Bondarzewia mesenterica]|uniref:Uncharacterized protein n=1 Tax=Bondarzewia mesenterica TaxID=1095465 RepID=A0A4S4L0P8_9AGAM|nr:hypothetical protein EW146_g10075 [Bondarzewia mesenterica]